MERLKNMGLKKSFFILSICCVFASLILVLLVFFICNTIRSGYPSGGVELGANGAVLLLEQPTPDQQRILDFDLCSMAFLCFSSCLRFGSCGHFVLPPKVKGTDFRFAGWYRTYLKTRS